jgi:hypothetical protein
MLVDEVGESACHLNKADELESSVDAEEEKVRIGDFIDFVTDLASS